MRSKPATRGGRRTNFTRPTIDRPPTAWLDSRAITAAFRNWVRRFPATSGAPFWARKIVANHCPINPIPEEQRRLQEIETARVSRLFSGTENRPVASTGTGAATIAPPPVPDLAGLGLAPPPATPSAQDRQLAFLNAAAERLNGRLGSGHSALPSFPWSRVALPTLSRVRSRRLHRALFPVTAPLTTIDISFQRERWASAP